jgi:hypothetical protein
MDNGQVPTAIVTGASSGIGLSTVQALLEHGYCVVANSRNISKSKDLKTITPQPLGRNFRDSRCHLISYFSYVCYRRKLTYRWRRSCRQVELVFLIFHFMLTCIPIHLIFNLAYGLAVRVFLF